MKINSRLSRIWAGALLVFLAFVTISSTGCTINSNGMTLPSPWYHWNRPQYHSRGTEFPFPNEAANLQEVERDRQAQQY